MTIAFELFEGTCPSCGGEVEITGAGGTAEFFDNYGDFGVVDKTVWAAPYFETIGSVHFKCSICGALTTVDCNVHGDWNC